MKKKSDIALLIASIVFFVTMGSVFILQRCSKSKQFVSEQDYTTLVLAHVSELEKEITGHILDSQWAFWGNDSLSRFPLTQFAITEKIFFYFTQNVCPPCLIATVDIIKQYFPDYEQNDTIIFISPDWTPRLRYDCYGKKLLTLQNGKIGVTLEEDIPLFFKISNGMELTDVHIVTKVDFERTEAYLRNIVGASGI